MCVHKAELCGEKCRQCTDRRKMLPLCPEAFVYYHSLLVGGMLDSFDSGWLYGSYG